MQSFHVLTTPMSHHRQKGESLSFTAGSEPQIKQTNTFIFFFLVCKSVIELTLSPFIDISNHFMYCPPLNYEPPPPKGRKPQLHCWVPEIMVSFLRKNTWAGVRTADLWKTIWMLSPLHKVLVLTSPFIDISNHFMYCPPLNYEAPLPKGRKPQLHCWVWTPNQTNKQTSSSFSFQSVRV